MSSSRKSQAPSRPTSPDRGFNEAAMQFIAEIRGSIVISATSLGFNEAAMRSSRKFEYS